MTITTLVKEIATHFQHHQWKLATAESCTAGGLSYFLTSIAGSSTWFERGFVTYSNQAKMDLLQVNARTLTTFGAISEETAREMAEGALQNSPATVAIAITGIAGPDGGSEDKPVGTVWFAIADHKFPTRTQIEHFLGNRESIREQAIVTALLLLKNIR